MSRKIENLRPWKPGQSGNPGGRPKQDAITAALRQQLEAKAKGNAGKVADAIAAALVKRALRGDVRAIREIADRTEGKPRARMEISGRDGGALEILDMTKEQLERRIGELVQQLEAEK